MAERPMLFSTPMVQAILAGRKTQTRRVITPQPVLRYPDENPFHRVYEWKKGRFALEAYSKTSTILDHCPHGKVGDRIWVRENWATIRDEDECSVADITAMNEHGPPSLFFCDTADHTTGRWRPSIHMPRWACRITLEIAEVKVQRLQDLRPDDAISEGITITDEEEPPCCIFAELWDSINAKRGFGWDTNPWVWALTFKVVRP